MGDADDEGVEGVEEVEVAADYDDFDLPPTPEDTTDESEGEEEEDEDEADAAADDAADDPADDPANVAAAAPRPARAARAPRDAPKGEIKVLPPAECITPNFLDSNEVARILSVRAQQIATTNDVFLPPGVARCSHDPVRLARQELRLGMCPMIVIRRRGQGVVEQIRVRDLLLLDPV